MSLGQVDVLIRNSHEHPLLYLPGTGIASQETAISGSFQQNLAGVCNNVCVWWLTMGWIPGWDSLWMVHHFVSAPNFVSVTPSTGILFPILIKRLFFKWHFYIVPFSLLAKKINWAPFGKGLKQTKITEIEKGSSIWTHLFSQNNHSWSRLYMCDVSSVVNWVHYRIMWEMGLWACRGISRLC